MEPTKNATSRTLRPKKPRVSSVQEVALTPAYGSSPKEGFSAATPKKEAGPIVEPPVCVPIANGKNPAATAAAEPEDEPPGVRAESCGLVVGPGTRVANSDVTVLPAIAPP